MCACDDARVVLGRPFLALTAVIATLMLGLALLLGGAVSARAHAELLESDPTDGATLDTMPASVTFTFNEAIDPNFAQAVFADESEIVRTAEPVVEGERLVVPVPPEMPGGEVEARYRVVSADGHPIAGQVTFTVDDGTQERAATDAPTQTAPARDDAGAGTTTDTARSDQTSSTGMYALTGFAVVLLGVVAAVIALVVRRRR